MNALTAFVWVKSRLRNRPDSEHGQVLVRMAITALFSIYLGLQVGGGEIKPALFATWLILLGELLLSVGLLVAILYNNGISDVRRWIGMLADYSAMGLVMHLQGETAAPLYGVYLWVTIGNGLRYGSRYLYIATVLCAASFLTMMLTTPYWEHNPYLSWGLLLGAIAVPLYFATLLKALTRAIEEARRANEAKSRFLANMSHELRTPLNGILAMAELLSASKLQKDQRESASMIQTSAQTLLLLIDEVLDISAIEAGKLRKYEQDFALHEMLLRIDQMLTPQAQSKNVKLFVDADIRIPDLLHGDSNHLLHILLNLMQNAIKFTAKGSVTLQVREMVRDSERTTLRFSVKDTGIGIPEEAMKRIFMPFEQVDSGRDRRYGGSGLGTTIAKNLTELMGGTIHVESEIGVGTHFWVDIPFRLCAPTPVVESQTDSVPAAIIRRADKVPANIIDFDDPFLRHRVRVRSLQIVVADDQVANRVVLQRLLEKAGHSVIFADDGETALDLLIDASPDLMIVDLHMPGLSGLDVIRQARVMQAGRGPHTPIVVLTADATVESMNEAERAGAYLYMTKPVSVAKLLDTVATIASDNTSPDTVRNQQTMLSGTTSASDTAPALLEMVSMGFDAQFLNDFVDQCFSDIAGCASQLKVCCGNADYEGVREAAHALRGVAENVGATALVERCRVIMRSESLQLAKQSAHLVHDIDVLIEQAAREIRTQLADVLNVDPDGGHGAGNGSHTPTARH